MLPVKLYFSTLSSSLLRLTAYVAKVFAMASRLVKVENYVLCDAIKFLIMQTQQPNGMFVEVGRVYSDSLSVRRLNIYSST